MGKCIAKNWNWKKVNAPLIQFEDSESNGSLKCVLESKSSFTKEELDYASKIVGYVGLTDNKLCFEIKGQGLKSKDKSNFESLKSSIENSVFVSADRALLAVKKAGNQITLFRCGSK